MKSYFLKSLKFEWTSVCAVGDVHRGGREVLPGWTRSGARSPSRPRHHLQRPQAWEVGAHTHSHTLMLWYMFPCRHFLQNTKIISVVSASCSMRRATSSWPVSNVTPVVVYLYVCVTDVCLHMMLLLLLYHCFPVCVCVQTLASARSR